MVEQELTATTRRLDKLKGERTLLQRQVDEMHEVAQAHLTAALRQASTDGERLVRYKQPSSANARRVLA